MPPRGRIHFHAIRAGRQAERKTRAAAVGMILCWSLSALFLHSGLMKEPFVKGRFFHGQGTAKAKGHIK